MSVSKWDYEPEKCDGDYCCGECDNCPKASPSISTYHMGEKLMPLFDGIIKGMEGDSE